MKQLNSSNMSFHAIAADAYDSDDAYDAYDDYLDSSADVQRTAEEDENMGEDDGKRSKCQPIW